MFLYQAISAQRTENHEGTLVIVGYEHGVYIMFIRHCQDYNIRNLLRHFLTSLI